MMKNKQQFISELRMKNQAKKELVKTQERQGYMKIENLKKRHVMGIKTKNKDIVVSEKELIKRREFEAQRLEKLEAELLQNLLQTQNMEKEAFSQLEHAMIDASKPKNERINQSRVSRRGKKSSKKLIL